MLNGFKLEQSDDVFVLQNGFYRFNGKWKQRGIGKLGSKEIEILRHLRKTGNYTIDSKYLETLG